MRSFLIAITASLIILSGFITVGVTHEFDETKASNLVTFAKAYGYVKYFHPSDEAANIDWNAFAAYGAQEVLNCKDQSELIGKLKDLFEPIAPSIVFSKTKVDYDFQKITPKNTDDYLPTYWQHKGVSVGMNSRQGIYKSVRANRHQTVDESDPFGNLMMSIDPEKYLGKEIKYSGWAKLQAKSKGTGHLWVRADSPAKRGCFFDNMGDRPIRSNEWQQYEIIGKVCDSANRLVFGSFLKGKGTLYLDDVQLHYKENDKWIEIPFSNSDFEEEQIVSRNSKSKWVAKSKGYSYKVSKTENKVGENCAVISYVGKKFKMKDDAIFGAFPKFGELIEKEIGENVYCQIPLNLYGNEAHTFPESTSLSSLENHLNEIVDEPVKLPIRLGNVINAYNVFQHFYPYFDVVEVDWDLELEKAIERSFRDETKADHLVTLRKFTAPLKDGHISVYGAITDNFVPSIGWEWIEDKLIVNQVLDENIDIKIGDEVTKINSQSPHDYFEEVNSKISAGTEGYLKYRAEYTSLLGKRKSDITLEINDRMVTLKRDRQFEYGNTGIDIQKWEYKVLDENIYYLNLSSIDKDTITSLLPKLKEANGIICDLRGYPNSNHNFISHLLSKKDTSTAWMRVPKIIYPDQKDIVGYEHHGWEMEPKEPYLGDKKIAFMIDGRAISYAESYMGFIEGYDLATIIGQPTAGTNGNVNPFNLLGNIGMRWTGMKVVKHDGSQHHAIGVLPDVYVNKTIEGIKSGKDEYLEKAIEVVSK